MKLSEILKYCLIFLLFNALQVIWVKDFAFFNLGFCFMYIAFIISLPLSVPVPLLLIIAFLNGLLIDAFYDTMGIHAAATVAIAYLRRYILTLLTPFGGYEEVSSISIEAISLQWYIIYISVLIFFHQSILFFIEASGVRYFFWTLLKIFCSSMLTTFMIVGFNYVFFTRTSRR